MRPIVRGVLDLACAILALAGFVVLALAALSASGCAAAQQLPRPRHVATEMYSSERWGQCYVTEWAGPKNAYSAHGCTRPLPDGGAR